jgi:hypothetical protein
MKISLFVCSTALFISTACRSSTEPASVAAISISPKTLDLVAGAIERKQLEATITGTGGTVLVGRSVVWTTSNKAIATVSPDGIVNGISQGIATITATSEGKSGTATINVLPMTQSLTGSWISSQAGPLSNLQLQLTEANTETVTGQWSAYVTGCTPSNSAECRRSGLVVSGYRHGSTAEIVLAPESPCGVGDVTMTAMFARFDSLTAMITQHNCNGPNVVSTGATLTRQQ